MIYIGGFLAILVSVIVENGIAIAYEGIPLSFLSLLLLFTAFHHFRHGSLSLSLSLSLS
jgi:hypothetical protein